MHELDQTLCEGQYPPVHGVGGVEGLGGTAGEVNSLLCLPLLDVLDQEPESVEPGQEDIFEDITNTFLLKAKGFPPHHGGVDEIQPTQETTMWGVDWRMKYTL